MRHRPVPIESMRSPGGAPYTVDYMAMATIEVVGPRPPSMYPVVGEGTDRA